MLPSCRFPFCKIHFFDLFFTFWGVAALRDPEKKAKKGFLDKMFGWMLPRGIKKLPLSKMQMLGIGPKMIRMVMKKKNALSLEQLMKEAAGIGCKTLSGLDMLVNQGVIAFEWWTGKTPNSKLQMTIKFQLPIIKLIILHYFNIWYLIIDHYL